MGYLVGVKRLLNSVVWIYWFNLLLKYVGVSIAVFVNIGGSVCKVADTFPGISLHHICWRLLLSSSLCLRVHVR